MHMCYFALCALQVHILSITRQGRKFLFCLTYDGHFCYGDANGVDLPVKLQFRVCGLSGHAVPGGGGQGLLQGAGEPQLHAPSPVRPPRNLHITMTCCIAKSQIQSV